ncbi:hypothetical protein ACFPAG_09145 [Vogesella sp. GCM10023246]|uniref:Uncharacterized protein n=1 Tax=Vogesella oryzagri TaxID=3160864 RepID=A0ABV1M3M6_9NEIS
MQIKQLIANVVKAHASKVEKAALGGAIFTAAQASFAVSIINWSTLASGVTEEATAAITAGIGVLALFLGVAGGTRMFKKFIG